MTHPAVGNLPEEATGTLLGICERLSLSRHPGLAQWASSTSDALLIQLVSVANGAPVEVVDFEPCGPLALLEHAELDGLHTVVVACALASADDAVVEWCTRMTGLVVADFYRRLYEQAAIDAKAAVIVGEERRRGCPSR